MNAKDLYQAVCEQAEKFGLISKNGIDDTKKIVEPTKGNAITRKRIDDHKFFDDGSAFFSFINPDEDTSGPYSDFSFVVFPNNKNKVTVCVVCLGVGLSGFNRDFHLATLPGLRRNFMKLRGKNTFFKTSFTDIETPSSELYKTAADKGFKLTDSYKKVLPAACIVDFSSSKEEEALAVIDKWLATYAKIRNWAQNSKQKENIENVLKQGGSTDLKNELPEIKALLNKRQFVVLQGAPGTGKTWNALEIARDYKKHHLIQFHAETTYSDFISGIEPVLNTESKQPQFTLKEGVLCKALKDADNNADENVLLIIDEINRANLANVLGPVFFLFENLAENRTTPIKIADKEYSSIPKNLHILATMNTADRSLAVVDFALRRRFAWYTLRPRVLRESEIPTDKYFDEATFMKFNDIFFEYATDDELNLQPGQSYFILDKSNRKSKKEREEEYKVRMKERMIYELMPLIKEYLAEGYLLKAKEAFFDLFLKETGELMYE